MCLTLLVLLSSLSLISAHFQVITPTPRGYSEDTLATFPCGGQDIPSSNRSQFPVAGGPIQLNMEHDRAEVQVLMSLGNNVGTGFNITLLQIVQEQGIGKFCVGGVAVPSGLDIKDGQNATIQVVTNGDPNGGLYNCADITFSSTAQPGGCTNGTGITSTASTGSNKNANGSDAAIASTSSSSTAPAPSSTAKSGAGKMEMGSFGVWLGGALVAALL